MSGNTAIHHSAAHGAASLGLRGLALLALLATAGLTGAITARAQDAGPPPGSQLEQQPAPTETPSSLQPAAPDPGAQPAPATTTADSPDQPSAAETPPPGTDTGSEPSATATDEAERSDPAVGSSGPRTVGEGTLPHDLSPWGMFMAADVVVKAVIIGLAFASVVTWTAWLAKSIELWVARRQLRRAIRRIENASSLSDAVNDQAFIRGAAGALVSEAAEEVARSLRLVGHIEESGVQERVTSRLSRVEAAANRRMMLGTGLLATIGSTAPFVGLFGTVWGIMNSFIGISQSQTTNLAVVAPGIAEALLATALGLVAAIPAVIIYNSFANRIAGYRLLLADASAGVERLVSLDLDLRRLPRSARGMRTGSAAE